MGEARACLRDIGAGPFVDRPGKLVADAKPLLSRLQSLFLRLQLVKRLAEASGFSQPEVERLCDLRPVTRPAPAKVPRQAPSLFRPLLRMLLQKLGMQLPAQPPPRITAKQLPA